MSEAPCPYCGEYLCEECAAAILGPGYAEEEDGGFDFEDHPPDCRCDDCVEEIGERWARTEGQIP